MAKVVLNMNCQLQSQLTRSLERILEEAHLSGELKLSGRKLKDFPRTGGKYDLTDTVTADLSKNRFWELPEDITKFWSLEKLVCYHNAIRSIPESIVCLQSLVHLDLSRNHLSTVPVALCQLPLETLMLANNRLTALPDELGQCATLTQLDVSCNQITHLPPQLGHLAHLRVLNVRNNLLLELPIEVTYLKLIHLDLSENRISKLPVELRSMVSLVSLELMHNPLVSPPASVCMRGRIHVFKYLELRCTKEEKIRSGWRSEERKGCRKLSDIRVRQRCDEIRWNSGTSTPSTLSPGDSGSMTNSEEGLNEICKKRLERSSSEREVSRQNSSENGIKSLSSSSLGSRFSKATTNGLSPTAEQTPNGNGLDPDSRPLLQHVQSYREYKEALRQQRGVENIYRPKTNQDEPSTPNHIKEMEQIAGDLVIQNQNQLEQNHRKPVQKVIPSRNGNFSPPSSSNDIVNGVSNNTTSGVYVKPASPQLVAKTLNYLSSASNGTDNNKNAGRPPAWNRSVPPDKLSFTMRREFEKAKEEAELIKQLRTNIETRLKMALPSDLAPALSDGVVLCHLANHVRPRSVASIHVPSPAVPKLTMARCRRNVDNFLEACRRIGVEEGRVCRREAIMEGGDLAALARTVHTLLAVVDSPPPPPTMLSTCLCLALLFVSLFVLYILPPPD
ncbi:leucine-rich repeat and calponin homology domain-containing protein isoform X2 [Nilaparvata lugens]|uniref:leucine-rich repeat and calponin homology domain-containing protein isoform X2 n=1 Tax=Nilaparvata lugens TaxID=108931 RepID=UPI00193EA7EA|nr:leucine-rich repeat and calponin homology domain-containing protein isoform X2 [Nilaparvata lugens]